MSRTSIIGKNLHIYIYMHIHTYTYIHVYNTYIYIYIYLYMYTHLCMYTHIQSGKDTREYTHTYVCIHTRTHVQSFTRVCRSPFSLLKIQMLRPSTMSQIHHTYIRLTFYLNVYIHIHTQYIAFTYV